MKPGGAARVSVEGHLDLWQSLLQVGARGRALQAEAGGVAEVAALLLSLLEQHPVAHAHGADVERPGLLPRDPLDRVVPLLEERLADSPIFPFVVSGEHVAAGQERLADRVPLQALINYIGSFHNSFLVSARISPRRSLC